jgi:hypothetical protein
MEDGAMPKEVIAHPRCEESNEWNEAGEVTGRVMVTTPRLTLHWSALNSTELALNGGVSLSIGSFPAVSMEEFGAAKCWPPEPEREQYTAELDRGQLNKLILLLRKARDAAYGRDE